MDPRKIFWRKSITLPGTSWNMSGYSRSAYRSGFFVNGLNIMLDAGPQSFKKPGHICITHCHGDHIAELAFTMICDSPDEKEKITIYCPEEAEKYLRDYISQLFSTNSLTDASKISHDYYNLVPVKSERESKRVIINKQPVILETVGADHSVPTVVYGISFIKQKLDPKYKTLSGKEIAQLKKTGAEVSMEVIEKKFCYVLDTSIKIFELNPFLLEYPVVIVECTFLLEDELEHAVAKKHIHWDHLKPYVVKNPNVLFILTHFSLRYDDLSIKKFFDDVRSKGIENIYPWLSDLPSDNLPKFNFDKVNLDSDSKIETKINYNTASCTNSNSTQTNSTNSGMSSSVSVEQVLQSITQDISEPTKNVQHI